MRQRGFLQATCNVGREMHGLGLTGTVCTDPRSSNCEITIRELDNSGLVMATCVQ